MRMALDAAQAAAANGEVPVGAVLVRDGEVLAVAANAQISNADPSAHAEVLALRHAAQAVGNYRLPGSTLYVTIEPCTMCAGALVHARVARLVFGADEPRAGAVHSSASVLDNPGLNHRVQVTRGVCADEAAALLRTFFAERRKAAPRADVSASPSTTC